MERQLLLNKSQIAQKIKRIAYQILEDNYNEEQIVLAGIKNKGVFFTALLARELEQISTIRVVQTCIHINKDAPTSEDVRLDLPLEEYTSYPIIVVDDVTNSGQTLAYALKPLLHYHFRKIRVAVLIDRQHKSFPVAPDFIGYSLATTLQEHIQIEFDKEHKTAEAYLC